LFAKGRGQPRAASVNLGFFCVNIVNGADGLPRCYIRDLDHLKERLRLCWAQLSQHQVTKAIAAVPKRLEACLASGGARFEHRLL